MQLKLNSQLISIFVNQDFIASFEESKNTANFMPAAISKNSKEIPDLILNFGKARHVIFALFTHLRASYLKNHAFSLASTGDSLTTMNILLELNLYLFAESSPSASRTLS
jgi:hypothetical protein